MLILILFTSLVINFCGIQCNGTVSVIYVAVFEHEYCFVTPNYTFPTGIPVMVTVKNMINDTRLIYSTVEKDDLKENGTKPTRFNFTWTNSEESSVPIPGGNETYKLHFSFLYGQTEHFPNGIHPQCHTVVFFAPAPSSVPTSEPETSRLPEEWKMPLVGAGVAVGILVIALAAAATYYRTKVKLLNRHKNLNMRSDKIEEEEESDDRYSSYPLQKGKKGAQISNQSRESDIYEDPKITLGVSPMPPALPTSPRPGRTCNTLKMPPSKSSTLISNASSQMTFPRRNNPLDKDTLTKITMANRPPLPLPQDEFYNEAQEDDTYEPPPIHELLSKTPVTKRREKLEKTAKPIPEKIVRPRPERAEKPTPHKLGKKLLHIPMDGLKPPGMNIPPKPHGVPVPQRNNAVQVPVQQIPDPSSLKRAPPVKPKPPVALPKTVPMPSVEAEEYQKDRHDSTDDEEWTYEPLPSFPIYSS